LNVHFTSETCFCGFEKIRGIIFGKFKTVGDGVESLYCEFTGYVESICNSNRVDSTIY
jgi:hypothetical protein